MTIFVNLALLVMGSVATLAAFGGKTWLEGSEPFLKRVTTRGWISLISLALALILGIAKVMEDSSQHTSELMDFRSLIRGSAIATYTIEALLATLAGLIIYCGGNFWDECAFGPRYGIDGTYLTRKRRPFGIFPAGDDLSAVRREAAKKLDLPENGEGAYKKSEDFLRRTGRWKEVLPPIVLSKVARSFIWPALLAAIVTLILAIARFAAGAPGTAIRSYLFFAMGSSIIGFLAFIPYFELRVKHMTQLYSIVASSSSGFPEQTPADGPPHLRRL